MARNGETDLKAHFARSVESLEGVFELINSFAEQNRLERTIVDAISVASEELFMNAVRHNPKGKNDISLELLAHEDRVVVLMTDYDSGPIELPARYHSGVSISADDVQPGGRGLLIIRSLMDKFEYHQDGRISRFILTKMLGHQDV